MRDVFYYGKKPNAHPKERLANSLDHARKLSTTEHFWIINEYCDYKNFDWDFDFDFLPDEDMWTKDHNNVWPSQHQKDSGTWLCPKLRGEYIIYRTDVNPVIRKPTTDNWQIPDNIEVSTFDFSWHPDPTSPPYIYVFGTQHQIIGGPRYLTQGASQLKYMDHPKAKHKVVMNNWEIPDNVDISTFDFSWHPHPDSPPYIYIFGTKLNREDGPRYRTSGATQLSYMLRKDKQFIPDKLSRYYIETTLDDLIAKHPNEVFWALNKDIDYSNFNFNWLPLEHQAKFIHAFGTYDNIDTQTYFVNAPEYVIGKTQINYVSDTKLNIKTKLDIFFIDRGNKGADEKYKALQQKHSHIQKTRYLNSWIDTVNRCINKSSTELFYVLDSCLNYENFEFDYYPNPWQMNMLHVFGTQWGHWGTTFLINKNVFQDDTKYLKQIEHVSAINFVKDKRAIADTCLYDILIIDFGNKETETVLETIRNKAPNVGITILKYENSYHQTIKTYTQSIIKKKEHFVWVVSSICDYTNFDFTYMCDPFSKEFIHAFPSNNLKYGDTFLLELNAFDTQVKSLADCKVNYNNHQRLKRYQPPIITSKDECLVDSIRDDYNFPYAVYKTSDAASDELSAQINLWNETKTIITLSTGAASIIAPKETKQYIRNQVYDYPYIEKAPSIIKSKPIDIVFLSNGESCADEHYLHLLTVLIGRKNRVVRVDGINGRAAAYHAALAASNTPWAFTVFAKLKVNENFDWDWQPDRLQKRKHFIFYATNPVNGLEYGHQAMIAYNKKLVLNNPGLGLDFTLDDEHEVIELNSGVAHYNTDEFTTWRTAFREAIKLRHATDDISKERLDIWLSVGNGKLGEYSVLGAKDAVCYYEAVEGDINKLKLSYEWSWLRNKFNQIVKK
jgi:hypothetical protein